MSSGEDEARLVRRFRRMKGLVTCLVIAGLVVQAVGRPLFRAPGLIGAWAGGTIFQIVACVLYLRLKGRSGWLGLIGILGIFGVVAIFFMDKRCHACGLQQKHDVALCTRCGAPL